MDKGSLQLPLGRLLDRPVATDRGHIVRPGGPVSPFIASTTFPLHRKEILAWVRRSDHQRIQIDYFRFRGGLLLTCDVLP